MRLHIYEHCPFCARARMIFGLKKITFILSVIPEGNEEIPTKMVGRKVVPILEKDDGAFMAESMDIVRYVDGLSEPRFANGEGDAAINQWCDSVTNTLFRLVIPRFTRANFAELATKESRDAYTAREYKAFGNLDVMLANTPELLNAMNMRLEQLEILLTGRAQINISDFFLYPLLRSLTIVSGAQFGPNTGKYINLMSDKTGVNTLFDQAQ